MVSAATQASEALEEVLAHGREDCLHLLAGGERRVAEGAPSAVGHDASRWKTLANVGMPADGQFKQLVALPPEPAHVGGGNGNAMVLEQVAAANAKGASVEILVLMMAI